MGEIYYIKSQFVKWRGGCINVCARKVSVLVLQMQILKQKKPCEIWKGMSTEGIGTVYILGGDDNGRLKNCECFPICHHKFATTNRDVELERLRLLSIRMSDTVSGKIYIRQVKRE